MAKRTKKDRGPGRGRRCRNCPDDELESGVQPTAAAQAREEAINKLKASSLAVTEVTEGNRLWHHVLFGTGSCVGMIEGYVALGMPGNPLPHLLSIRDRLNNLIRTLEVTAGENA